MKWDLKPRNRSRWSKIDQVADKGKFRIEFNLVMLSLEELYARLRIRVGKEYILLDEVVDKSYEIVENRIETWMAMTRKELLAMPFANELIYKENTGIQYEFQFTSACGYRDEVIYNIIKAGGGYSNPNHGFAVTREHLAELDFLRDDKLDRKTTYETSEDAMKAIEEDTEKVVKLHGLERI